MSCTSVYSLVLEDGCSCFQIGRYDAVSLGHGIRGDPVAEHDYFGTNQVLKELAKMDGWKEGHIILPSDPVIRDKSTKLVVGFKSNLSKSSYCS